MAWWINADNVNQSVPNRSLEAEILDTEKDPNTIRIKAIGLVDISIFLNDELVDLDRPVRVEINGKLVFDKVPPMDEGAKELGRDPKFLFNRNPKNSIRKSRYYGWLRSAALIRMAVPAPPAPPPAPTGPAATPREEEVAAKLKAKCETLLEANPEPTGDVRARIIKILERVAGMPRNAQSAWAKEQLAALTSEGGASEASGEPPAGDK